MQFLYLNEQVEVSILKGSFMFSIGVTYVTGNSFYKNQNDTDYDADLCGPETLYGRMNVFVFQVLRILMRSYILFKKNSHMN